MESEIPTLSATEEAVLDPQIFSNKRVNICLNESNFLLWKQQVVLTIRGLGLEGFLDGSIHVPSKTVRNSAGADTLNPLYLQHVKQDSSLASWLLSTISPHVLPQLVGADTTTAIWKSVSKLYSTLSTTKVMNLHCRLRSMKKGAQTMTEYTMAIKQIYDLLASCGNSISEIEHIATILNGLPIEYEPSIAAITASREAYTVENIVSILVDAESRTEDSARFPVGINYTNYNPKQGSAHIQSDSNPVPQNSDHVPHSSNLGHSAGATTSASVGSASIRVEAMGEHSNTVMHEHESPRQTGELRSNGPSSEASSESSRELSLPASEPLQEPADHSMESHEELSVASSPQGEPQEQEVFIPDMHWNGGQPESTLHTSDHVHSSDAQLDIPMPIVEPVQNDSSQSPQQRQIKKFSQSSESMVNVNR
ncbi:hypothetical protein GQ457_14G002830 [Hibiscus cannabinus]